MPSERDTLLAVLRERAADGLRAVPGGERRWAHSERVYGLGRQLARQEGADRFVVGVAALFHDWPGDDIGAESRVAAELAAAGVPAGIAGAALDAIAALERDDATGPGRGLAREALVLRDADRLDDLGAVGLARLLLEATDEAALYDRDDPFALLRALAPERALTDRLYTRISTLPRAMRTASGRQIAARRAGIMLFFLESLRDDLAEATPDALLPEPEWLVPREQP